MMYKKPNLLSQLFSLYISFFMIFWCKPVLALPQGGSPLDGGTTITNPSANALHITQQVQREIINWQSFSIGNGQLTEFFKQGGGNFSTLNRVTGGNLSEIYGTLRASNGNIYLVNPNGVLIGSSGLIDVNTFVASTLDVNNGAFLSGGDMIFGGTSDASIENLGTINAVGGDVFLIARNIKNAGTINAPEGTVGLAAGKPADGEKLEVLLKASGSQRIFIRTKKIKEASEEDDGGSSSTSTNSQVNSDNSDSETADADSNQVSDPDNNSDPQSAQSSSETDGETSSTSSFNDSDSSITNSSDTLENPAASDGSNNTSDLEASSSDATDTDAETSSATQTETNNSSNLSNAVSEAGSIEEVIFEEIEPEYEYVWEPVSQKYNVGEINSNTLQGIEDDFEETTQNTATESVKVEDESIGILNTGIINAVQAELKAVGGNEYALAINNTGEIRATGVETGDDGSVRLIADSGTIENASTGKISAKNADGSGGFATMQSVEGTSINSGNIDVIGSIKTGGTVHVLGDKVNLSGNSLIQADGATGGGTVLIGGDYRGKNPDIQNASQTIIGYNSLTTADALGSGNGGQIIGWGNDYISVLGNLKARGGLQSGDGGFIETSAAFFDIRPNEVPDVSARADTGIHGEWLIDPRYRIDIVNGTSDGFQSDDSVSSPFIPEDGDTANITLGIDVIKSALMTGDVTITNEFGDNQVAPTPGMDIYWSADFDYDGIGAGKTLQIDSYRWIIFETGTNIYDSVGSDDNLNFIINGSFDMNGGTINTGGGDFTINGAGSAAHFNGGTLNTAGGDLIINNSYGMDITSGSLVGGGGTMTIAPQVSVYRDFAIGAGATGSGTVMTDTDFAQISGFNEIVLGSSGTTGTYTVGNLTTSSNLTFANTGAGSNVTLNGTLDAGMNDVTFNNNGTVSDGGVGAVLSTGTVSVNANSLDLTSSGNDIDNLSLSVTGNATLNNTGLLNIGSSSVGGDLGITTTGAITTTGPISVGGSTTIDSGGSTVNLSNTANDFNSVTATNVGDIHIGDSNGLTIDQIVSSGVLNIDVLAGDVLSTGSLTVAGTTTLSSGTGAINLSNAANDFSGTVSIGTSGAVTLHDMNDLTLGTATGVNGAVNITSGGNFIASGAIAPGSNDVNITSEGQIDIQTNLNVGGAANINLTSNGTSSGNYAGVYISGGITSTNSGTVTINGAGGDTTTNNHGVLISGGSVSTTNGAINITGTGGTGFSHGVYIDSDSDIIANNAATVTINGTGHSAGGGYGVAVIGTGTTVTTDSGTLNINGTGGNAGATNHGITMSGGSEVSSTSGAITFNGTGGNGTGENRGVHIDGVGTILNSNSGIMTVNGTGGSGTLNSNVGVMVMNDAVVKSTTGAVSIAGTGGMGASYTEGVRVEGLNTSVETDGGNLSITGTSGTGSSNLNSGVVVYYGANVSTTGSGTLDISGTANASNNGTDRNYGVWLDAQNSLVTVADGNMNLTGAGAGTDASGVIMTAYSSVTSTGSGNINIAGTGGTHTTTTATSHGVLIDSTIGSGFTAVTASSTGDIDITGTGGGSTGSDNHGVYINGSGTTISTVDSNLNISGTAGGDASKGVVIAGSASVKSTGTGATTISGAGAGSVGVELDGVTVGSATSSGDIKIISSAMNLFNGAAMQSSGAFIRESHNAAQSLVVNNNLGGALTDGFSSITLGRADDTAGMSITAANTFSDDVTIQSATGNISIDGALNTGADNLTLTTDGNITQTAAITSTGLTTIDSGSGVATLTNASNDFGTVAITGGVNADITDTNGVDFDSVELIGNLNVTASGDVTDTDVGDINVGGTLTVDAGSGNITFDNATSTSNHFNLTGNDISVSKNSAYVIDAINALGNLSLLSNSGNISQIGSSGAITVAGTATLGTGAGSHLQFDHASNDFGGMVNITGAYTAAITDMNSVSFGTVDSVISSFTVVAADNIDITQDIDGIGDMSLTATSGYVSFNDRVIGGTTEIGSLSVNAGTHINVHDVTTQNSQSYVSATGTTTGITAASTYTVTGSTGGISFIGDMTLTNEPFMAITNGGDISITGNVNGAYAMTLTAGGAGSVNINGDLNVGGIGGGLAITAGGGDITNNGAWVIDGDLFVDATGSNNITLLDVGNNFNSNISLNTASGNVQFHNANGDGTNFGMMSINGDFDANSSNGMTQTGVMNVSGTTTLDAGSSDIDLSTQANDFGTVSVSNAGNVLLKDSNNLDLGAMNIAGSIFDINAGSISNSGAIDASSASTTITASGDVSLSNGSNDFNAVSISAGNAVSIVDQNNITLGNIAISSDLSVSANTGLNSGTFAGVTVSGAVNTGSGDISIIGYGGDTGTGNHGVEIVSGGSLTTSSGNIDITGEGGDSNQVSYGVHLNNSSTVSTGSGFITIEGHGGNADIGYTAGVIMNGATVESTGTGVVGGIEINGFGGNGDDNNRGIHIYGSSTISTVDGNISISGTGGGNGNGYENHGITIRNSSTNISSTGTGTIEIVGNTTQAGYGIDIRNYGTVVSTSGSINLSGESVDGYGFYMTSNADVHSLGSANILISGTGGGGMAGIILDFVPNTIGGQASTGNIALSASGDLLATNTNLETDGNLSIDASGNVSIANSTVIANDFVVNAGGSIDVTGTDLTGVTNTPSLNENLGTTASGGGTGGGSNPLDEELFLDETTDPFDDESIIYYPEGGSGPGSEPVLNLGDGEEDDVPLSDLNDQLNNVPDTEGDASSAGTGINDDPVADFAGEEGDPIGGDSEVSDGFGSDDEPIGAGEGDLEGESIEDGEPGDNSDGSLEGDEEGGSATDEEQGSGEDEGPVDDEGEGDGSEETATEEDAPDLIEEGQANGTDTTFDDTVLTPGDTFTPGGNETTPPPSLNTATAPQVRGGLGSTNASVENVPPPPATPVPPPVPPAPPELDAVRALPGQTLGMNFGNGPQISPPPQIQIKLDVSVSPDIANSLKSLPGF